MEPLELCPLCGHKLIIGTDGHQYIRYDPEWRAKFDAGEIDLDELSKHIKVFYDRTRLCDNAGNNNKAIRESEMHKYSGLSQEEAITRAEANGDTYLLNPPCPNYYGKDGHTIEDPFIIVETLTIEDN